MNEKIIIGLSGGVDSTVVAMGIECGDNETARTVLKRNTTNERIEETARILKKNKIKLMTQNLIGLPVQLFYFSFI